MERGSHTLTNPLIPTQDDYNAGLSESARLGPRVPVKTGDESGLGGAVGGGIMSGFARLGAAADLAASVPVIALDSLVGGTEYQDAFFEEHDNVFKAAKDYWRLDPDSATTANNIAFGLSQGLTQLVGGPVGFIGAETMNTAQDFAASGVGAGSAVALGVAAGTAGAIGIGLPGQLGTTLTTKLASGAGINVAAGFGLDMVQKGVLSAGGYGQAKDIDPFDLTNRSVDLVMGAAFGAISPNVPVFQKNVALTSNLDKHTSVTLPGNPATSVDANRHVNNLNTAITQVLDGQPVVVPNPDINLMRSPALDESIAARGRMADEIIAETRRTDPEQFLSPDQIEAARYEQRLVEQGKILGLDPEKLQQLAKATDQGALRDAVTGLYEARVSAGGMNARMDALGRLQKLVEATGADAVYVHADIQNLGGLNKNLDEVGANAVFKEFARLMDEEAQSIEGARAVSFRHGGDEISAVVLNASREQTEAVMRNVARRIQDYAAGIKTDEGVSILDIPHAKAPDDVSKKGTGLTTAVEQITPGRSPESIIKSAAARLELNKDVRTVEGERTGDRGNGRRATDGAAQPDSGGAGRGGEDLAGIPDEPVPGIVGAAREAAGLTPEAVVVVDGQALTAADALRAADEEIAEAQRMSEGILEAANCFLRTGNA